LADDWRVFRLALALFAVQAGFHGFTASLPVALARAGSPTRRSGWAVIVGLAGFGVALLATLGAMVGAALVVMRDVGLRRPAISIPGPSAAQA
jgi:hypothetical protein